MKKALLLVLVLISLNACDNKETSSSLFSSKTETDKTISDNKITGIANTESPLIFSSKNINDFIYRKNFFNVNDWIYYCAGKELRKCKPDLTADILLEQDIFEFYIHDSTLYFAKSAPNNGKEIYRADLNNENFYTKKISELKETHNWMIYKNSIIYTKDITNELMIYDIEQNAEKEIICDNTAYFSILDHYIYYNLYDDDAVYRYDIDSGQKELFLEFEKQDNFAPKVYYRNRIIIIQIDVNKFVYINTYDKISRELEFDISEYERGWTAFHFADNENLYFSTAEHYDVANPLTSPHNIYKIKIVTEQIEFVKEVTGDNIGFLTDGYLYSFDEDYFVHREKF